MPPESRSSPEVSPEFFSLQQAVAGRYSLVRELGRGGMGVVFLARDVALDRPVAIKMLPPSVAISRERREEFLREARTAARLSHPHIVPIHAVEELGDVVIIVMGFIDGETLTQTIARSGTLPAAEANRIVREVAWALAHAHANGVVHRDIKPDNILIESGSRRAIVTDFGIARGLNAETSGSGRIVGTPRFMSPEQGAGERVDGRSDLYSLGAVAFYATVGRVPFDGTSAASILVRHLNDPVPSVLEQNPTVPLQLARVIERCLAKDPAQRFATADELALSLQAADPVVGGVAPPIRDFLRISETLGAEIGTMLSATLWSIVLILFVRAGSVRGDFGVSMARVVAMVLYTGAAVAMLGVGTLRLGQVVREIRSLLRAGYGYRAVRPAILSDLNARPQSPPDRSFGLLKLAAIIIPVVGVFVARDGPGYWPLLGAAAAIGNAAGELLAALPENVRCQYPELPALITRLEERAAVLGRDDARFASTVAALESLRMDLLRLHAVSAKSGGLTEDVVSVNRIGDDIAARIAALDDVARLATGESP